MSSSRTKKTQAFCTQCAASISIQARYCSNCGHEVAADALEPPILSPGATMDMLVWDMEIPLLTSGDILGGVLKALLGALLIMGGLMTVIFGSQGNWHDILPMMGMLALVTGGLLGVAALVMGLVFRNRLRVRYSLDPEGIRFELTDTTARTTNRLVFWLGILTGRPQAIGAGLIAQSQETVTMTWEGAFAAVYDSKRLVVTLKNRWRKLLVVHCTPQNYASVASIIERQLEAHGTSKRYMGKKSPLPGLLGLTLLTIAACVPAFLLSEEFHVHLLLPICLLCFSLTTVWLLPVFGYVNIGLIALHIGAVIIDALSKHRSYFNPSDIYRRWAVYDGDDWALLVLAGLGFTWLTYFSVGAIRGRFRSALASDMDDMGE